jgi:hypothetical protein
MGEPDGNIVRLFFALFYLHNTALLAATSQLRLR